MHKLVPNVKRSLGFSSSRDAIERGLLVDRLGPAFDDKIGIGDGEIEVLGHLVMIGTDPLFTSRAEKLGATSLRLAMPAIYQYREFTAAGGVMSYGGSTVDSYHHAGPYVGWILEKPSDLPVQLSTKVELFLNLKSAKALALSVPLPLLGRADEVIE